MPSDQLLSALGGPQDWQPLPEVVAADVAAQATQARWRDPEAQCQAQRDLGVLEKRRLVTLGEKEGRGALFEAETRRTQRTWWFCEACDRWYTNDIVFSSQRARPALVPHVPPLRADGQTFRC